MTMLSDTIDLDLTEYENRLATFATWNVPFISPKDLAYAGFYYTGEGDNVRCAFCFKIFFSWECNDDPNVEHKRESPRCPLFIENPEFPRMYTLLTENINVEHIQQFLHFMGILIVMFKPYKKDYVSYESRLKTFEKCKKKLKQSPQSYAEAGFIYIVKGGRKKKFLRCFFCGQVFSDRKYDDLIKQHALSSPQCTFLIFQKGQDFIDRIQGVQINNPFFLEMELRYLFFNCEDITIYEDDIKFNLMRHKTVPSDACVEKDEKISAKSPAKQTQTPTDSKLCKICCERQIELLYVPCSHAFACIPCSLTLGECAVCRNALHMVMELNIVFETQVVLNPELPCSSSQSFSGELNPMLCKVCHVREMDTAFITCKHVYACITCACNMIKCPVCSADILACVKVYL